jgi:hypothetical protein
VPAAQSSHSPAASPPDPGVDRHTVYTSSEKSTTNASLVQQQTHELHCVEQPPPLPRYCVRQLQVLPPSVRLSVADRREEKSAGQTRRYRPGVHAGVGLVVGTGVGQAVGFGVGAVLGVAVGEAVGSGVGDAVGEAVGTSSHSVAPLSPAVHFPLGHAKQDAAP